MNTRRWCRVLAVLAVSLAVLRALSQTQVSWTTPMPPFRIAGNLYYVGSQDLAAYLLVTPKGDILINSNLASSPALIRKSVAALGFPFADIRILLISHAHYDHCAGSAEMLRETHARYEVMGPDVPVVESGGRTDFHYAGDRSFWFAPTHVDRVLRDGDTVALGGTVLTAHLTPGHTKGTTTWTLDEDEGGRRLHVVIVGSPNVNPGYRLVANPRYPGIAEDYRRQFDILNRLPCDIFLGAHGSYFGLEEKYARLRSGDRDAFVDPSGYRAYIADRQQAFEAEWSRQAKH